MQCCFSSVVYYVICTCTCNLHLGWTPLEVINLQCHVIPRAQWRPAIKSNLGKEMVLSIPFFPHDDDWGHLYYHHRDVSDVCV